MTDGGKSRAMISQPMGGVSDVEIRIVRDRAFAELQEKGYRVVNTLFSDFPDDYPGELYRNGPLFFLANSLLAMSSCDAVYFCEGWENARGCRIEHEAAVAYGLNILYET